MEFLNDDMEEEKEELSDKLVASLKQKITALKEQIAELHIVVYDQQDNFGVLRKASTSEQIAELHIAVYDQQDDFGVLRKASTSGSKCFTKALGDPSLYNDPSP
jgi:hypothetical protein